VLEAWPLDARAVAAMVALLALPGLVAVLAPWRAMPLLSLAFWVISWTWLGGAGRTRFVHAALAALVALALLRVLRPGPVPRPRPAHLVLAAVALMACLPAARRTVPSGPGMPLESVTAELLAWHDGWPVSFEPLLPVAPFRASGVALLAGDVLLLTGARPHRAVLIVAVATQMALLLALWSLAALRAPPPIAAGVTAIAMLAVAGASVGPGTLATAFAVQAVALWHDRRGHPSAFAAGACAAAAVATDPATGLAALAVAAIGARVIVRLAPPRDRDEDALAPRRHRLRTAVWTTLVLGLPLLVRRPPISAPEVAPLVALGVVLAFSLASRVARPGSVRRFALATLAAAAVVGALLALRAPSGDINPDDAAALGWIRAHARPLDQVCAPDVPAARWIPAMAARPASISVGPGWPAPSAPCTVLLSLSGVASPGAIPRGPPAFRSGSAAVWTTSQDR
jgi:hypothetical protein